MRPVRLGAARSATRRQVPRSGLVRISQRPGRCQNSSGSSATSLPDRSRSAAHGSMRLKGRLTAVGELPDHRDVALGTPDDRVADRGSVAGVSVRVQEQMESSVPTGRVTESGLPGDFRRQQRPRSAPRTPGHPRAGTGWQCPSRRSRPGRRRPTRRRIQMSDHKSRLLRPAGEPDGVCGRRNFAVASCSLPSHAPTCRSASWERSQSGHGQVSPKVWPGRNVRRSRPRSSKPRDRGAPAKPTSSRYRSAECPVAVHGWCSGGLRRRRRQRGRLLRSGHAEGCTTLEPSEFCFRSARRG
jgi:hypothetical protein